MWELENKFKLRIGEKVFPLFGLQVTQKSW